MRSGRKWKTKAGCWATEIRVVQHIEGFQPEIEIQPFVQRKQPRNLSIELEVRRRPKCVPADIPERSHFRASIGTGTARRRHLSESGWLRYSRFASPLALENFTSA